MKIKQAFKGEGITGKTEYYIQRSDGIWMTFSYVTDKWREAYNQGLAENIVGDVLKYGATPLNRVAVETIIVEAV